MLVLVFASARSSVFVVRRSVDVGLRLLHHSMIIARFPPPAAASHCI